jgi:hypothetical protein
MGSKQCITDNDEDKEVRFVPTEQEVAESRRNIERIKEVSRVPGSLTRSDLELILGATRTSMKEQGEESQEK